MSPRAFDSFLVLNDVAHKLPVPRLAIPERWCWVAGVKALASKSPIRGALLMAPGEPASVDDVARQADVSKAVAKSTLDKLVRWEILEHDDELGCLVVTDWHEEQKEPKPSDSREAWTKRKREERARKSANVTPEGHATVTRDSHANGAADWEASHA